jgi:radial spoke head protein 4A
MSTVEWAKSSGLQDVMTNVLSHVAEYSPICPVQHFEMLVQKANLRDIVETVHPDDAELTRAKNAAKLFQKPLPPVPLPEPAEGEEPQEFKPDPDTVDGENDGKVDDIIGDLNVLEHAGVGLGREQAFRLYTSLKKLAKAKPAEAVHFFGIIRGTNQDYYIAEVSYKERDPGPGDEPKGEGEDAPAPAVDPVFPPREDGVSGEPETWLTNPNQYVYFVCHSPGPAAVWKRLPDVLPKHVALSRRLRRIFSGDLNAPVLDVVPAFPGTEAHLLRAQIARIRHGVNAALCFASPRNLAVTPLRRPASL